MADVAFRRTLPSQTGRQASGQPVEEDRKSQSQRFSPVCYLPECWPCEKLKLVEKYPPSRFLVVSQEMLALLSFPVVLRNYPLVILDP
jgi:hypothetical protein